MALERRKRNNNRVYSKLNFVSQIAVGRRNFRIIQIIPHLIKYEEKKTNDDNLESNLLTSSLLKRCLVYMLVQDELRTREQAIHHFKLLVQRED